MVGGGEGVDGHDGKYDDLDSLGGVYMVEGEIGVEGKGRRRGSWSEVDWWQEGSGE